MCVGLELMSRTIRTLKEEQHPLPLTCSDRGSSAGQCERPAMLERGMPIAFGSLSFGSLWAACIQPNYSFGADPQHLCAGIPMKLSPDEMHTNMEDARPDSLSIAASFPSESMLL